VNRKPTKEWKFILLNRRWCGVLGGIHGGGAGGARFWRRVRGGVTPGGGAGAARGGCRRWVPGCGFLKGVVPQILLSVLNSGEVQHSVPARDVMAVERSGDRGYETVLPGGGGGDDAGWVCERREACEDGLQCCVGGAGHPPPVRNGSATCLSSRSSSHAILRHK